MISHPGPRRFAFFFLARAGCVREPEVFPFSVFQPGPISPPSHPHTGALRPSTCAPCARGTASFRAPPAARAGALGATDSPSPASLAHPTNRREEHRRAPRFSHGVRPSRPTFPIPRRHGVQLEARLILACLRCVKTWNSPGPRTPGSRPGKQASRENDACLSPWRWCQGRVQNGPSLCSACCFAHTGTQAPWPLPPVAPDHWRGWPMLGCSSLGPPRPLIDPKGTTTRSCKP